MKHTKTIWLLAALIALFCLPTFALAQRPMGGNPPAGMTPHSGMTPPGGQAQKPGKEKPSKKKKEVALENPSVGSIYMMGFSASFADSIALLTSIQHVDSVHLLKHNKLVDRNLYSLQLEEYAENVAHLKNSTNAVYFSKNKNVLVKKYAKLAKMYLKSDDITLVKLGESDFRFKPEEYIAPVEIIEEDDTEPATNPTPEKK